MLARIPARWPLGGRPLARIGDHAIAAVDGKDRLALDLRTGALLRQPGCAGTVTSVGEGPPGAVLSCSEDGAVRVWDLATGADQALQLPPHSFHASAACSPDGSTVYVAGSGPHALAWDLRTGATEPVTPVKGWTALSLSGDALLLLQPEKDLRSFDLKKRKVTRLVPRWAGAAGALAEGACWAASSQGGGRIWIFLAGQRASAEIDVGNAVHAWATSPDGRRMAASSPSEGVSMLVDLPRAPRRIPIRAEAADHLAIADDGRILAARGSRVQALDPGGAVAGEIDLGKRVRALIDAGDHLAAAIGDGWVADELVVAPWPSASSILRI